MQAAYGKDSSPQKLNLGIGVYRTEVCFRIFHFKILAIFNFFGAILPLQTIDYCL